MTEISASVNAPRAAQVNLLPPEVAARRSRGRARVLIIAAVAALVVVLAGVTFLYMGMRADAERDRDAELARTPVLQAELAEYDYLPELEAELQNSLLARFWAGATDVMWADQLAAIGEAMPPDTTFSDVTFTGASAAGQATTDGTPFGMVDLGGLNFVAHSLEPVSTSALMDQIDAIPGFYDTYVTAVAMEANEDSGTVYWIISGSTRVSEQALSGRFVTEQTTLPPGFILEGGDDAVADEGDQEGGTQ